MENAKPEHGKFLLDPVYRSSLVLRSSDLTTPKTKYYDIDLEGQKGGKEDEKDLLANAPARVSRRRRGCSVCCCYTFYITFIVLLALGIVVIKLIPKEPSFTLGDPQVTEFVFNDSSSANGARIQASVTIGLNVSNRNPHADAIYQEINLTLYFNNASLGNFGSSIHGFEQKKKMTTALTADLPKTVTTIQNQANVDSLKTKVAAGNVPLLVTGSLKGKLKVLGVKVKKFNMGVHCMLNVQPGNGGSQAPSVMTHSCYYDA